MSSIKISNMEFLAGSLPEFGLEQDKIILTWQELQLNVTLKSPEFVFDNTTYCSDNVPSDISGEIMSGELIKAVYEPIALNNEANLEIVLFIKWFPEEQVLRKWARYCVNNESNIGVLKEVVLDKLDNVNSNTGVFDPIPGESMPGFLKGFFAGIEFPAASTRIENGKLLLAHRPGFKLVPGKWYETRKAVYGIAPVDKENYAFQKYILANRKEPRGFHINYNSWWTSPIPYSEDDIIKLMEVFKENLYDKYGVSFNSFCIDLGWSNPKSIWEIDSKLFPEGFAKLNKVVSSMCSHLGLWFSPAGAYPPAINIEWAEENGYETSIYQKWFNFKTACMGGGKYRQKLKENIIRYVKDFDIRQLKLDCYVPECTDSNHGHGPGQLSQEAIAEGFIDVLKGIHEVQPEIWIEYTQGVFTSPWWLFYVNTISGNIGDDSPNGRVPAPFFRESYTSTRDYYNLMTAPKVSIPVQAQDLLGIVHQNQESFMNDAVMVVMRGHMFLPVYINPAYMNEARWKALAAILKWARDNVSILEETEPVYPASWINGTWPDIYSEEGVNIYHMEGVMPREPYGYAHWKEGKGLVAIRNPWIAPCTYQLELPECPALLQDNTELQAVCLYPESRLYGQNPKLGDSMDIQLAPYETIVLSIDRASQSGSTADSLYKMQKYINANILSIEISSNVVNKEQDKAFLRTEEQEGTVESNFQLKIGLNADVDILSPQAELLVLLEGDSVIAEPEYSIEADGMKATASVNGSESGWVSTLCKVKPENWLFIKTPLSKGKHNVQMKLTIKENRSDITASVWVWAVKPGNAGHSGYPDALPEPELISLDSVALLKPVNFKSLFC